MKRKPTDFVQFKLRIRRRTLNSLRREAKRNGRSVNGEGVARLEASLGRELLSEALREMVGEAVDEAFHRTRTNEQVEAKADPVPGL
jgi:hypothetical protein